MSSGDESDAGPQNKRKRKPPALEDSPASTSSGSPIIGNSSVIRGRTLQGISVVESSDTDNSGSPILNRPKRKIVRLTRNSDSDSSDDSVIRISRTGKPRQLLSDSGSESDSQWTSDFSEDETRTEANPIVRPEEANIDSDFSDGQSEKCPICLARFKSQEIGTPESCDHTFCLECIQEWSKNMNTCPVDRQEYNLILVRSSINGKVAKQIPIPKPTPQNDVDIIEDPTYCEVCGSCDNEDRMLLCDGCDLGFHLYCLNPPLEDIPIGAWHCNDCSPDDVYNSEIELFEVHLLLDEAQSMDRPSGVRRRESNRLIPRTQQSERVRRQIVNNRQQNSRRTRQNNSIENDDDVSMEINEVGSTSSRNRTSRRPNRRTRQSRTRTVYEIDAATGETVAVQKSKKKKKKKKSKRRKGDRIPVRPKTVKKRLAHQLGICKPRSDPQHLPDVCIPNPQGRIREMRFSAGIPNIDLFGNHQDLDYFSEDDEEYSIGSQLLARRAPNQSDVNALRRAARRKAPISLPETVSSTTDLLDNILSSQEQFLARNATYSVDPSGKFKIERKESNNYIDVKKEKASAKETPYYNNRNYNNRYQNNRYQNNRYNNRQNYYSSNQNQNYNNSEPSSSIGFPRYSDNRNRDNYDCPQDYTQRTLCASTESEYQENKDKEENANNANESEVDIYSDIETVSTSKVDGDEYGELMKPPTPPELPDIADMYPNQPDISNANAYGDEDNDSEPDMVIDDERVQEHESNIDEKKEEAAVTSTVDYSNDVEPPSGFFETDNRDNFSAVIQSGPVQSSNLDQIKIYQYDDEDDSTDGCPNSNIYSKETLNSTNEIEEQDSDDGCPNFSIYSKESKTVALHTDISISQKMADPTQDYQVGEISSSPNVENANKQQETTTNYDLQVTYDPKQLYDPEKMYDPEDSQESASDKTLDQSVDPNESYDPEQCFMTDENLDEDKISNSDQTYDPEKAFDDDSSLTLDKTFDTDKSYDLEKEIQDDVSINATQNDDHETDGYDPAMPYDDDLNEDQDLPKLEDNPAIMKEQQNLEEEEGHVIMKGQQILEEGELQNKEDIPKSVIKGGVTGGLYSDSEDESVVKIDNPAFAISDINHMTEDISEEERSYTPCMDEKSQKQGLEGLDTELISDEDRNDFDESHELKTGSDQGDALEINAKESELDFARPEDYEEGEIVDKNKDQSIPDEEPEVEPGTPQRDDGKESNHSKENEEQSPIREKNDDKENESNNKEPSFKKLSKSTKERNYRDKDKEKGKGKDKDKRLGSSRRSGDRDQRDKKDKRKEKRREIERYNVRALIAEKPRSIIAKDQFGRDIRDTPSRSRSRSYTPPIQGSMERDGRSRTRERSLSRRRKSPSKDISSRKRRRSPTSRSRSPAKKRSRSKNKKRKRSPGRYKKRRSSRERTERTKTKKRVRSHSRNRSLSASAMRNRSRSASALRRQRDWEKEWTLSPPPMQSRISPSWTPPRVMDNSQVLRNENLTVTLNNTGSGKKKKEKRKKGEKRNKDGLEGRSKKRRSERERTPPPSKEVFASGDNILVSVSFNNENETRDITTREKRKNDDSAKKKKKKKNRRDLTGVKPVAIIDLDRSPFRELTPSPKQVIILSDSDNEETENLRNVQQNICDSSQQVASPEHAINYSTGPKTPPEPQVKFSLNAKPPQVRAINNPLHDPDDLEPTDHVEEELLTSRLSPGHKGPNTPPEPPNSPPSSPDAYDPFEPTKSRSPTPDPMQTTDLSIVIDEQRDSLDGRHAIELLEKSINPMPEVSAKSLTPPLADVQPADSQSSIHVSPDSNIDKSPDRLTVVQSVQPSVSVSKPVAQTTPFSSVPTSMITSTPISGTLPPSRVNILNTTIIAPTTVASSIPQRIVLPNQVKSSPVKISPTKAAIKSTPIKPMPTKSSKFVRKRAQNSSNDDLIMELDSPYSPGSSDYEDLFEPPSEIVTKPVIKGKQKTVSQKHGSTFDALFGSPSYKTRSGKDKSKFGKKSFTLSKTKTVGVKVDEDNLKILEDLPNSAVEMQVKDKFLKKLNRQERVVEEVKLVLKPHYNKKRISKEEYKDILRRSVPKICHNKTGEINPTKIKNLIEAYVRKIRHSKKVTSSSSVNTQKV